MQTVKVPIADAKFPELKKYAEEMLGIDVPVATSRPKLLALIEATAPGTSEVPVDREEAAPPPVAAVAAAVAAAVPAIAADEGAKPINPAAAEVSLGDGMIGLSHHQDPRVELIIPATKDAGGTRDVQVGVNGVAFLIQRGKRVEVPYRVYEALDHAVETAYELVQERPTDKPDLVPHDAHSYSFSVTRLPPPEEVAAWRERVKDQFAP